MEDENEKKCKILELSNRIIIYILSYLDATSLYNLSRTCLYFKNITRNPQLWRYIEARHEPNSNEKVHYVCERVQDKTRHLFLRAESKHNGLVPENFLVSLSLFKNMTIIALENQRFDGLKFTLSDFPQTLEELSLKETHVRSPNHFIMGSCRVLTKLKVWILDDCDWVDSSFLLSIPYYENLEILSIIKCINLHFPAHSMCRPACKKLRVIDSRFNSGSDLILRTIDSQKTLLALYFQSMNSYQLDTGTPFMRCDPMSALWRKFISSGNIKDNSLEAFKNIVGDLIEELPESVLYKDPYSECSCGYKDRINKEPFSLSNEPVKCNLPRSMPVDDFINFNHSTKKGGCRNHAQELNKMYETNNSLYQLYKNSREFSQDPAGTDSDSDDDRYCCVVGRNKSYETRSKIRVINEKGNWRGPTVQSQSYSDQSDLQPSTPKQVDFQPSTPREVDLQPSTPRQVDLQLSTPRLVDLQRVSTPRPIPEGFSALLRSAAIALIKRKAEEAELEETDISSKKSTSLIPGPSQLGNFGQPEAIVGISKVHAESSKALTQSSEASSGSSRGQVDSTVPIEAPRVVDVPIVDYNIPWIRKNNLRRLALRGYTGITDEALLSVRNLNLDLLDVTYTEVTKEGVEKFLTFNPNCRVIHEGYCVCKPRIPSFDLKRRSKYL